MDRGGNLCRQKQKSAEAGAQRAKKAEHESVANHFPPAAGKVDAKVLNRAVLYHLTQDSKPLNTVEGRVMHRSSSAAAPQLNRCRPVAVVRGVCLQGFIRLLSTLGGASIGRTAMTKLLGKRYLEIAGHLKDLLKDVVSIRFTSDGWCAITKDEYFGVTIHFMDTDFRLHRFALGVVHMPGTSARAPRPPRQIFAALWFSRRAAAGHAHPQVIAAWRRIFTEFGILKKIYAGTTDNASYFPKAFEEFPQWLHVRCAAHTVQLSVNRATEAAEELIAPVRAVVNLIRNSSRAARFFKVNQTAFEQKVPLRSCRAVGGA